MRYVVCCLMVSLSSVTFAQDAKEGDQNSSDSASLIKATEESFRELIIGEAANFDSEAQSQAISVVQERHYRSARFDDSIRAAMKIDETTRNPWANVFRSIELMPFSTLTKKEQVGLVLDVLVREEDRYATLSSKSGKALDLARFRNVRVNDGTTRLPTESMIKWLSDLPQELAEQLQERLTKEKRSALMCAVAVLTEEKGKTLLPQLLEAARSDDPIIKMTAIATLHNLLAVIEQSKAVVHAEPVVTDEKMLKYAERIVGRYDTNKDRMLSPDEWSKMLMSPINADTDHNGQVSIAEYAQWMQKRNK